MSYSFLIQKAALQNTRDVGFLEERFLNFPDGLQSVDLPRVETIHNLSEEAQKPVLMRLPMTVKKKML